MLNKNDKVVVKNYEGKELTGVIKSVMQPNQVTGQVLVVVEGKTCIYTAESVKRA